jgi:hypothetical protein
MGGSIGEDGEARPCILELALASGEKNGLHLVACFSWKKGDELRRQRDRHKYRAFGHALGYAWPWLWAAHVWAWG